MKPSKQHTMQSIVEARRFARLATKFLLSIGAVRSEDKESEYPLQIETKAGPLSLRPETSAVYGRFQDVKRACELLNQRTKRGQSAPYVVWNKNYFDWTLTAEQALYDFEVSLMALLPPEVSAPLRDSISKTSPSEAVVRPPVGPVRSAHPVEPAKPGFFTKVVGVSYENKDGTSRQSIIERCRPGEILRLVREPDNPHDTNAVKVLRQNGEQLGYLPGHVVMTGLARDMDRGNYFRVEVEAITRGGEQILGVNIRIADVPEASDSEAVGSRQVKVINEAPYSIGTRLLKVNPFIYLLIIVAAFVLVVLVEKLISS
jgi:hypothetical protein